MLRRRRELLLMTQLQQFSLQQLREVGGNLNIDIWQQGRLAVAKLNYHHFDKLEKAT